MPILKRYKVKILFESDETTILSKIPDFRATFIVCNISGLPKKNFKFLFFIFVEPFLAQITHNIFINLVFFYFI